MSEFFSVALVLAHCVVLNDHLEKKIVGDYVIRRIGPEGLVNNGKIGLVDLLLVRYSLDEIDSYFGGKYVLIAKCNGWKRHWVLMVRSYLIHN